MSTPYTLALLRNLLNITAIRLSGTISGLYLGYHHNTICTWNKEQIKVNRMYTMSFLGGVGTLSPIFTWIGLGSHYLISKKEIKE